MIIIFIICYWYNGIEGDRAIIRAKTIIPMLFIGLLSLCLNLVLIGRNDELQKKADGNCPELERVENVYKIKQ